MDLGDGEGGRGSSDIVGEGRGSEGVEWGMLCPMNMFGSLS